MARISKRPHFFTDFSDNARNSGWWFDDAGTAIPYRRFANDVPKDAQGIALNPFPNTSDATFALRHFGMVRVEQAPVGYRIEWDALHTEPNAMKSVQTLLEKGQMRGPVSLSFRYGGWAHEHYADADAASRRISQLEEYRGEAPETMIAYEDHELETLSDAIPLLREALGHWSQSKPQALEHFTNGFQKVAPYTLFLSESNAAGSLFYRRVGAKAHMVSYLGRDWARDVVGSLSTHGHSDVEFEQIISEPYFEAIRTGRPQYSHVRALFAVDEAEPDWVSYQRLILPYVTVNGENAVAIMVAPDQDVSIPFLTAKSTGGVER